MDDLNNTGGSPRSNLADLRKKRLSYFEKASSVHGKQSASPRTKETKRISSKSSPRNSGSLARSQKTSSHGDNDRHLLSRKSVEHSPRQVREEQARGDAEVNPRQNNVSQARGDVFDLRRGRSLQGRVDVEVSPKQNSGSQGRRDVGLGSNLFKSPPKVEKTSAPAFTPNGTKINVSNVPASHVKRLFEEDNSRRQIKESGAWTSSQQANNYESSDDDDVALEIWGIKDDVKKGNLDLKKYLGDQATKRTSKGAKLQGDVKMSAAVQSANIFLENNDRNWNHVSKTEVSKSTNQNYEDFFSSTKSRGRENIPSPVKTHFEFGKTCEEDLDNLGLQTHRPGATSPEKQILNLPVKSVLKKNVENPKMFDGLDYEALRSALGDAKFKEFVDKSMKDVFSLQENHGKVRPSHKKSSKENTPVKSEQKNVSFTRDANSRKSLNSESISQTGNSERYALNNSYTPLTGGTNTFKDSSSQDYQTVPIGLEKGNQESHLTSSVFSPRKQFKVLEAQQSLIQSDLDELGLSTHRPAFRNGSLNRGDQDSNNTLSQSNLRYMNYEQFVAPPTKAAFSVEEIYTKAQQFSQAKPDMVGGNQSNLYSYDDNHQSQQSLSKSFSGAMPTLDLGLFDPPKYESLFGPDPQAQTMQAKSPQRSGGHQRTASAPETPRGEHVEAIRKHHEHKRQLSTDLYPRALSPAYSNSSLDRYFSSLQDIPRDTASVFSSDNFEPIPEPVMEDSDPEHGSGLWIKTLGTGEEESGQNTAREIRPASVSERLEQMGIDLGFLRLAKSQTTDKSDDGKEISPQKEASFAKPTSLDDPLSGFKEHSVPDRHVEQEEISKPTLVIVCPECAGLNKSHITWCLECGCVLMGIEPVPMKPKKLRSPPKVHNTPGSTISSHSVGRKPSESSSVNNDVREKQGMRNSADKAEFKQNDVQGSRHLTRDVNQFLQNNANFLNELKLGDKVENEPQKPSHRSVDMKMSSKSEPSVFSEFEHQDIPRNNLIEKNEFQKDGDVDLSIDLSSSLESRNKEGDNLISDSGNHINEDNFCDKFDDDFDMFDRTNQNRDSRAPAPVPTLDLDLSGSSTVLRKEKNIFQSVQLQQEDKNTGAKKKNSFSNYKSDECKNNLNNYVNYKGSSSEEDSNDNRKNYDDPNKFLSHVQMDQRVQPIKSKGSALPSKSKGKQLVSSKVKESIDAGPYQRHWAKSSIAWSSYNSRELNTRSSQDLRKFQTSGRPSSAKQSSRPSSASQPPVRRSRLRGLMSSDNATCSSSENINVDVRRKDRPSSADARPKTRPGNVARPDAYHTSPTEGASAAQGDGHHVRPLVPALDQRLLSNSPPKTRRQNVLDTYNKFNEMSPRILVGELSMWECLPDEILLHIFSFLPREGVIQCGRVCRQFHRVALDNYIWKEITLRKRTLCDEWLNEIGKHRPSILNLIKCQGERYDGESVTNRGLRDLFHNCGDRLKELSFSGCSKGQLTGDGILLHASTHCKNITVLDASWCSVSDSGVSAICDSCLRLESLTLNGCQGITDSSIAIVVQKHGNSLNHLGLFGCFNITPRGLQILATHCKHLRSLSLGQCYKLNDTSICDLSKSLTFVEHLDIRGCKQVKDNCVRKISRNCKNLQSLTLANCSHITDAALTDIAVQLPQLRLLDVSGCRHISDNGVRSLSNGFTRLESIDLSSTAVTQKSVNMLASYCSRYLEELKVSFCKDITETSILKLARNCKRLKILHIYGCKGVKNITRLKNENPLLGVEYDGNI